MTELIKVTNKEDFPTEDEEVKELQNRHKDALQKQSLFNTLCDTFFGGTPVHTRGNCMVLCNFLFTYPNLPVCLNMPPPHYF